MPDFSTVSRRQAKLQVQLNYRPRPDGLHLLVDSTGIKFLGEGEWKRKKHGAEYRRQWRKVHLGIDAQTLEIRAIEVTDNAVGDAPMLPHLLEQIAPDEPIASVSADGAYDTKACHAVIAERGAAAVIRRARTHEPGRTTVREREFATMRWRPARGWGEASGKSGAATTGAASWRPRCTASSAWASG